ncbi:hypothetical protein RhiirA1_388920 [Rhizophagus irregularis]|uniref:Uncharacterized protein n=1 Tax=Rhizophagus irregularis TaxID=588596 RepID=A0A2N0SD29_9GLOM|nr:hypothetical protein RhiirA1_388920 [Rhizophagus irregularis]
MRKNITLILIFIIATFSNFTFATAPLKCRGNKLFDAFRGEKSFTAKITSSNLTLEERAICPAGTFGCSGTDKCCETICASTCGSSLCCSPNTYCCKNTIGCCPLGTTCCGIFCCELGQVCQQNRCVEAFIPTSKPSTTKPPIPKPTLVSDDCSGLTEKSKTSTYRNKTAKADGNTFVYILDPITGKMKTDLLENIRTPASKPGVYIVSNDLEADHVFEAQILPNYLKTLGQVGQTIFKYIFDNPSVLEELKGIINDEINMRFLSKEVNNGKGSIFSGQNSKLRDAVREYLTMDDAFEAYSKTRDKVTDFLRKTANEALKVRIKVRRNANEVHMVTNEARATNEANDIINSFENYSRSLYEDLTNRKLPPNKSLNNSSTLSLSYLPVILSMTLSLIFFSSQTIPILFK